MGAGPGRPHPESGLDPLARAYCIAGRPPGRLCGTYRARVCAMASEIPSAAMFSVRPESGAGDGRGGSHMFTTTRARTCFRLQDQGRRLQPREVAKAFPRLPDHGAKGERFEGVEPGSIIAVRLTPRGSRVRATVHPATLPPRHRWSLTGRALPGPSATPRDQVRRDSGRAGALHGIARRFRDRKSTRLNSSHLKLSRMPSSA